MELVRMEELWVGLQTLGQVRTEERNPGLVLWGNLGVEDTPAELRSNPADLKAKHSIMPVSVTLTFAIFNVP
jgi:hypothetical protein